MPTAAEVLGLDPEQISRAADFLEAYANTLLTGVTFDDRSAVGEGQDSVRREELATALQQAAQWRALVDVSASRSLFVRAGRHYWAIGRSFGLFVLAATWEDEEALEEALDEGVDVWIGNEQESPRARMIGASLRHPQQQAYLMLARAGSGSGPEVLRERLRERMDNSAAARSGAPMGAVGTPTHLQWALASWLMEAGSGDTPLEAIAEMAGRYHSAVRTARLNTYLWTNGAAPIDVMDVDLAGTASLFALRFQEEFVRSIIDATVSSEATYLASVPLELGLALAVETGAARAALKHERARLAADERSQQEELDRAAEARQEAERRQRYEAERRWREEAERRDDDEGKQMDYFHE